MATAIKADPGMGDYNSGSGKCFHLALCSAPSAFEIDLFELRYCLRRRVRPPACRHLSKHLSKYLFALLYLASQTPCRDKLSLAKTV